jgi:predicted transposase YdaD
MDLDAAVDAAIDEMPDHFVIKPFLVANRSEVKNMFLTEYDEKKVLEMEREEGRLEGLKEGEEKRNNEVAADMIKEGGMSVSFIARMSKLSESDVRNLADSLGISVL